MKIPNLTIPLALAVFVLAVIVYFQYEINIDTNKILYDTIKLNQIADKKLVDLAPNEPIWNIW